MEQRQHTSRIPSRLCGAVFSAALLQEIKAELRPTSDQSRAEIARRVCDRIGWFNAMGQPKLISCRVALLRLHRLGFIELPPPRNGNGNGKKLINQKIDILQNKPIEKPVEQLHKLRLVRVHSRHDSAYWNSLIDTYHYLGYTPLSGAQVRYIIRCDEGDLGAFGFSAAAWKVGVRDQWIGWHSSIREKNLHFIVNNSRFLIFPHVRSPNLASRVLSLSAHHVKHDFEKLYGYSPVLLETFVEVRRFQGTCYQAANWIYLGETRGRGKLDRNHEHGVPVKSVFVYPLIRNVRQKLCGQSK